MLERADQIAARERDRAAIVLRFRRIARLRQRLVGARRVAGLAAQQVQNRQRALRSSLRSEASKSALRTPRRGWYGAHGRSLSPISSGRVSPCNSRKACTGSRGVRSTASTTAAAHAAAIAIQRRRPDRKRSASDPARSRAAESTRRGFAVS